MSKKQAQQKRPGHQRKQQEGKKHWILLAAVVVTTWIAFSPSLKNGWTNWDDNVYVAENPLVTSLSSENIKAIFDPANAVSLNYHPLTILSLALDYSRAGYDAHAYHFTNLFFHVLATALVFWFVFLLSGRKPEAATIVALFFGIHPMHVESVAWISERKDVLYAFFFMASLVVYLWYLNSDGKKRIQWYMLCLGLFLLSILSKAMAVVLPLVLILIDYYKERKFDKRAILEKLPFFALAVVFGLLATNIQSQEAIAKFETFTLFQRFMFAAYGVLAYIGKLLAPVNLSNFYPYPVLMNGSLPLIYYLAPVIVLGLFVLVWLSMKRTRAVFFGFGFFLATVALVLQFISVGQVIMADRYSYLPYIGLLFPIAMGYEYLKGQHSPRLGLLKKAALPLLAVCAALCIYLTWERCKVWSDSDTLWTDAISKFPHGETYRNRGSYLVNKAAYDKGVEKVEENEFDRALEDFNVSIAMSPTNPKVFTNRANIYGLRNEFEKALADYSKAIELSQTDEQTYFNRAITYSIMKQFDKAIEDYNMVLKLKPGLMAARQNRAYVMIDNNMPGDAIPDLTELIKYNPSNADYYFYRGLAYNRLGKNAEALTDYNNCIQLKPDNAAAYFNRSVVLKMLGRIPEALADAQKAQSLGYQVDVAYLKELGGQ